VPTVWKDWARPKSSETALIASVSHFSQPPRPWGRRGGRSLSLFFILVFVFGFVRPSSKMAGSKPKTKTKSGSAGRSMALSAKRKVKGGHRAKLTRASFVRSVCSAGSSTWWDAAGLANLGRCSPDIGSTVESLCNSKYNQILRRKIGPVMNLVSLRGNQWGNISDIASKCLRATPSREGAAYIIEANLNPARCHMLAPDLEAWLKSDGTSNRSRVTNVATLSARDLFEAGLNEADLGVGGPTAPLSHRENRDDEEVG
jgi:hypothetical protein